MIALPAPDRRTGRRARLRNATIAVVRGANRLGAIAVACRIVYAAQRAAAQRRPPAHRVPGPADHQHESRQGSDCLLLSWRARVRAAAGALQADAHRRSGRPRAVADHDQERNRLGPETRIEPGIGVDVDLDDLQPSGVPVGEVLEPGRARSARSAPRGARVNEDGHRGARLGNRKSSHRPRPARGAAKGEPGHHCRSMWRSDRNRRPTIFCCPSFSWCDGGIVARARDLLERGVGRQTPCRELLFYLLVRRGRLATRSTAGT